MDRRCRVAAASWSASPPSALRSFGSSLASYDASDPAPFFRAGAQATAANFVGPVGAFLAELWFQLFRVRRLILIPSRMAIVGWNYFWCRSLDAAVTKVTGAVLLFA